jgi:hypothetical protein
MQIIADSLFFAPSDLITFMESAFASHMERWRLADENVKNLMDPDDPMLVTLRRQGYAPEDAYLESLRIEGKDVVKIDDPSTDVMLSQTREAMSNGVEIIAQAYLKLDNFGGMADFLVKVPGPSQLGDYHYEIWDAKLSKKMKPYFAVQLCCYAEMLAIGALHGERALPQHWRDNLLGRLGHDDDGRVQSILDQCCVRWFA